MCALQPEHTGTPEWIFQKCNKEAAKEFPFCQEVFFTSLEDSSIDKRETRPLESLQGGPGPQSKALRIQHKHLSSSSREETNSSAVAVTVKNT